MKGNMVTVTKTSLSTIVYIVTALVLSTAVINFVVASLSYSELSKITSQSSIDKDALTEIMGITNELIFFTIVGIAYILVGRFVITYSRKFNIDQLTVQPQLSKVLFWIPLKTRAYLEGISRFLRMIN